MAAVTKHHSFEHISEASAYLSPKLVRTYQYENIVQKILRVAKACSAGTPPHRIGVPLMHENRNVLHVCLRCSLFADDSLKSVVGVFACLVQS